MNRPLNGIGGITTAAVRDDAKRRRTIPAGSVVRLDGARPAKRIVDRGIFLFAWPLNGKVPTRLFWERPVHWHRVHVLEVVGKE